MDDLPSPNFMLTVAAAPLRIPKALTMGGGMRSWGWLILKFSSERSVCAPQYLSLCTWTSPKASLSVRVAAMMLRVDENWRVWNVAGARDWIPMDAGRGNVESVLLRMAPPLRAAHVRFLREEGLVLACARERRTRASAGNLAMEGRNMAMDG